MLRMTRGLANRDWEGVRIGVAAVAEAEVEVEAEGFAAGRSGSACRFKKARFAGGWVGRWCGWEGG